MTESTPASSAAGPLEYNDNQAMDDIQALLTSPNRSGGEDACDEIAEIIQRTGRSMAAPRLIHMEQGISDSGLPWALIVADDTFICATQEPEGDGINIAIWATGSPGSQHLRVEVFEPAMTGRPDAEDPGSEIDAFSTRHSSDKGVS